MSQSEAQDAVDNPLAEYETLRQDFDEFLLAEAEETAREQGEEAAETGTKAASYLSMALILGLFAASIGGILGVRDLRDEYETHYVHHDPEFDSPSHVHSDPHLSDDPNPSDDPHPSDRPGK